MSDRRRWTVQITTYDDQRYKVTCSPVAVDGDPNRRPTDAELRQVLQALRGLDEDLAKAWKAIRGPGATQNTYIIDIEVVDSGEMPGEGEPDAPKRLGRRKRVKLPRRSGEGGFTLIELLVVVIILGLLVGLVGPRLLGRVGQSRTAAAKAQIELLGAALDQYKLDNGSYPTTDQGPVPAFDTSS